MARFTTDTDFARAREAQFPKQRSRPIYSIRTFMGGELWWTTSRKRALEIAAQLTEAGDYVHSNGCVGHSGEKGLKEFDLPVVVHKCSAVKV